MYDDNDIVVDDHMESWVNFLVQLARHRYGMTPDKIIGIVGNVATIHDDKKVLGKLDLHYPLATPMPVDTIPLPTAMFQTGVDQPFCLIYNDTRLTAMMN